LSCSQLIKIIDLMEAFQDSGEHQVIWAKSLACTHCCLGVQQDSLVKTRNPASWICFVMRPRQESHLLPCTDCPALFMGSLWDQ
jgi:hypothetical protein